MESSPAPPSEAETANIIARHILVDREHRSVWAITIKDLPVGGVSLYLEKEHRIAEIGYSIKKVLWGKGFATEATTAVVDAAFETYPANIHPQNHGSIRVAERIAMDYEGTLRSSSYVRNEIADEAIYAILRSKWLTARCR